MEPGRPALALARTAASPACRFESPPVTSHRTIVGKPAAAAAASEASSWLPYGGRKTGIIGMPVTC